MSSVTSRTSPRCTRRSNGVSGPQTTTATAAIFRDRATQLITASAAAAGQDTTIASQRLPRSLATAVGAVETAVHDRDIAGACGTPQPVSPARQHYPRTKPG